MQILRACKAEVECSTFVCIQSDLDIPSCHCIRLQLAKPGLVKLVTDLDIPPSYEDLIRALSKGFPGHTFFSSDEDELSLAHKAITRFPI